MKDFNTIMNVKYVEMNKASHLVICCIGMCQIWNFNGMRMLGILENKEAADDIPFAYTCSTQVHKEEETYIAVGSNKGEIFLVNKKYESTSAFTMKDSSPITSMASDSNTRTLAVGNANGYIILFKTEDGKTLEPTAKITPDQEIPVTSLGVLFRGDNLLVSGHANGTIMIHNFEGEKVIEIGGHVRSVNAVACHPCKSIFCSVGDDTIMNMYEVTGDSTDKAEIDIRISSRVADYMLVGVTFGGEDFNSIVAVPYDYPSLTVWDDVI